MDPNFKIELTCDVPDIMNEEIVIQENGVSVEGEEVELEFEESGVLEESVVLGGEEVGIVEEEDYEAEVAEEGILNGSCYYEEAYIADGEAFSQGNNLVLDAAGNSDLQTAIDLAKFSEQGGKEPSSRNNSSSPQRYIILQYPQQSSSSSSTKKGGSSSDIHSYSSGGSSKGGGGKAVSASYNAFGKPKLSYAAMITEVIRCAPDNRLTLNEIYLAISSRYPYYKMDSKNWQNSIRHNLSLNHSFVKIPRPENKGRGHFWTIDYTKDKTPSKNSVVKAEHHTEFLSPNNNSNKYHIFNVTPSTV